MSRIAPAFGGCSCGKLRYKISAEPLTAYICHCHRCQKKSGSAFSLFVMLPAEGFRLEEGTPERIVSPGSTTYFCGTCHARVFSQRDGSPMINLRGGTLDETKNVRPVAQVWTSSAQPWAVIKDDILSYAEQPEGFGELFAAWASRGQRAVT